MVFFSVRLKTDSSLKFSKSEVERDNLDKLTSQMKSNWIAEI